MLINLKTRFTVVLIPTDTSVELASSLAFLLLLAGLFPGRPGGAAAAVVLVKAVQEDVEHGDLLQRVGRGRGKGGISSSSSSSPAAAATATAATTA